MSNRDDLAGVVFIIPSLGSTNVEHFHHTLRLAQRLASRRPVAAVVERVKGAPLELDLPAVWLKGGAIAKRLALAECLLEFRRRGFRHVYIRTSQAAAAVASALRPLLGGAVLYWHCGITEPRPLRERLTREVAKSELPFQFALRASSALVTGTPSVADWYSTRYRVRRNRIQVVPNDVDLSTIPIRTADLRASARQRLGLASRPKMALVVQRLSPVRRTLDYLPHLAAEAANQGGWEIAVVGGGPDLGAARTAASRNAFHGVVRFVGPVPSANVGDWYAAADLFVLPSRAEGFPRVLIEAMAWSLPIVTTDAGGIRQVMPPWSSGVIAHRDCPSELSAAFAEVMMDDRVTQGQLYRKWVERYDTPVAVESLDAILRRYDPERD